MRLAGTRGEERQGPSPGAPRPGGPPQRIGCRSVRWVLSTQPDAAGDAHQVPRADAVDHLDPGAGRVAAEHLRAARRRPGQHEAGRGAHLLPVVDERPPDRALQLAVDGPGDPRDRAGRGAVRAHHDQDVARAGTPDDRRVRLHEAGRRREGARLGRLADAVGQPGRDRLPPHLRLQAAQEPCGGRPRDELAARQAGEQPGDVGRRRGLRPVAVVPERRAGEAVRMQQPVQPRGADARPQVVGAEVVGRLDHRPQAGADREPGAHAVVHGQGAAVDAGEDAVGHEQLEDRCGLAVPRRVDPHHPPSAVELPRLHGVPAGQLPQQGDEPRAQPPLRRGARLDPAGGRLGGEHGAGQRRLDTHRDPVPHEGRPQRQGGGGGPGDRGAVREPLDRGALGRPAPGHRGDAGGQPAPVPVGPLDRDRAAASRAPPRRTPVRPRRARAPRRGARPRARRAWSPPRRPVPPSRPPRWSVHRPGRRVVDRHRPSAGAPRAGAVPGGGAGTAGGQARRSREPEPPKTSSQLR